MTEDKLKRSLRAPTSDHDIDLIKEIVMQIPFSRRTYTADEIAEKREFFEERLIKLYRIGRRDGRISVFLEQGN